MIGFAKIKLPNSARSNLKRRLFHLPELFKIGKNFSDLDHFV